MKNQATKISQENQAAQNKISELESQITNLNQQLQSIQQQSAISQWDNIKTAMEKETNSSRLANENYWDKQIQNLADDKLPADKKQITLQTRRRNHYNQLIKSKNQVKQCEAQIQISPK